jgi:hypothetical protein
VSIRTRELDERRAALQLRCAMQRQHFASEVQGIERSLQTVDRIAGVTRRVLGEPLVIAGLVTAAVVVGPSRLLRTISRGLLLVTALQRIWRLWRAVRT